jgi:CRISPR-associated protein Cmr2
MDSSNGVDKALLSFQLGPVQPFIEAARSVRDLWTGSYLLSWLTFQAMLPVIEQYGEKSIVFPSLDGVPLLDRWRFEKGRLSKEELLCKHPVEARMTPCIPNRFLAEVPVGSDGMPLEDLAALCEQKAREAWQELGAEVRKKLSGRFSEKYMGTWDVHWDSQVNSFFEMRTSVIRFSDYPQATLKRLLGQGNKGVDSESLWSARFEFAGRLLGAQRSVAHFPDSTQPVGDNVMFAPKCSLMGSFEQMGPADLKQVKKFWEDAAGFVVSPVRLRKGEQLCAVSLTKRFAGPVRLAEVLEIKPEELRVPDTATIAAKEWLAEAGISYEDMLHRHGALWNGQWLHWPGPKPDDDNDDEKCPEEIWKQIQAAKKKLRDTSGPPPIYYAILVMDGDEMGRWLRGDKGWPGQDRNAESRGEGSEGERLRQISKALTNFAVHVAPAVVEQHKGSLVYAGGDDVLALLPARNALACAQKLRQAFRGESKEFTPQRDLLMMGSRATISAGIALVHYKSDLRAALQAARAAEKEAKSAGRDVLQIAACRRSGEHSSCLCEWDHIETVEGWVKAFTEGASDRWLYHLMAEEPALRALPNEAFLAEVKRQVNRAETETRRLLGETKEQKAGEVVANQFDRLIKGAEERRQRLNSRAAQESSLTFKSVLTLGQTASFLARGRDE